MNTHTIVKETHHIEPFKLASIYH